MTQHYYETKGTSGRLIKKFDRIKKLEDEITRLQNESRYCDQERRNEINTEIETLHDSLKAVKSVVV